ncbi:MAG: ABC transporter permease [Acidobacteriia bacterium]|nr:ABC transporter permease [Terriglobia bacterium]
MRIEPAREAEIIEELSQHRDLESGRYQGAIVSGNYFDLLGVRAVQGRMFLPEEDRVPESRPVVVISYRLWTRRFGSDQHVVGSDIIINNRHFTIVGIAAKEFAGTVIGVTPDLWVPTMMQPAVYDWREENTERKTNCRAGIVFWASSDGFSSAALLHVLDEIPEYLRHANLIESGTVAAYWE